jgi:hypothetical protein
MILLYNLAFNKILLKMFTKNKSKRRSKLKNLQSLIKFILEIIKCHLLIYQKDFLIYYNKVFTNIKLNYLSRMILKSIILI